MRGERGLVVRVEIKNVEVFKVDGPLKSGALKIQMWVDPHDVEGVAELMILGAQGKPVDITINESADFLSQENGE